MTVSLRRAAGLSGLLCCLQIAFAFRLVPDCKEINTPRNSRSCLCKNILFTTLGAVTVAVSINSVVRSFPSFATWENMNLVITTLTSVTHYRCTT